MCVHGCVVRFTLMRQPCTIFRKGAGRKNEHGELRCNVPKRLMSSHTKYPWNIYTSTNLSVASKRIRYVYEHIYERLILMQNPFSRSRSY